MRASQSRSPRPKTIEVARDQIGETVEVGVPSLVVLPLTLLLPKEMSAPPEELSPKALPVTVSPPIYTVELVPSDLIPWVPLLSAVEFSTVMETAATLEIVVNPLNPFEEAALLVTVAVVPSSKIIPVFWLSLDSVVVMVTAAVLVLVGATNTPLSVLFCVIVSLTNNWLAPLGVKAMPPPSRLSTLITAADPLKSVLHRFSRRYCRTRSADLHRW